MKYRSIVRTVRASGRHGSITVTVEVDGSKGKLTGPEMEKAINAVMPFVMDSISYAPHVGAPIHRQVVD